MKRAVFACIVIATLVRVGNLPSCIPLVCQLTGFGCPKYPITGIVAPGFESVVEAFEDNFRKGRELGAHLTVYHKGELVVDVVGGYVDDNFEQPYEDDTMQIVFSSTKVLESLAIAMLADRGHLSYDDRISKYWPEFAANGKEDVTVGDLMSHAGGVAWVDGPIPTETFYDNKLIGEAIAATALKREVWRQAGGQGYHLGTRGFFASQLCHRADPKGRFIGQFVQEEIMRPLGLEKEFTMHLKEDAEHVPGIRTRLGPVVHRQNYVKYLNIFPRFLLPKWLADALYTQGGFSDTMKHRIMALFAVGSPASKAWKTLDRDDMDFQRGGGFQNLIPFMKDDLAPIEGPSYSGYTHAGVLGKVAGILAHGGSHSGFQLLTREGLHVASTPHPFQIDYVLGTNVSYTVGGFGRTSTEGNYRPHILGWQGVGGSCFQWSEEYDVGFGYTMSFYGDDHSRAYRYLDAAIEAAAAKNGKKGPLAKAANASPVG